jgi:hypothetical protein
MDDLTARLESLFRRYAAALEQCHGDDIPLAKQFYEEVRVADRPIWATRDRRGVR